MDAKQVLVVLCFALVDSDMFKLLFNKWLVARPCICNHARAGLNVIENEGFQRVRRAIQGNMQANATHSLFNLSALDGYSDNCFTFSSSAAFAGLLCADKKLVHFNATGQFFTFMANCAAPEFLQPVPCGAIAAKA